MEITPERLAEGAKMVGSVVLGRRADRDAVARPARPGPNGAPGLPVIERAGRGDDPLGPFRGRAGTERRNMPTVYRPLQLTSDRGR